MRRAVARALVSGLLVLATACAASQDDDADDDRDPCRLLSVGDASRIVGVEYVASSEQLHACFYQRPVTDFAFTLSVIEYDEGYDEVLADAEDIGYEPVPVTVGGADRAVALTGEHRSVLAEKDGVAYEVSLNGAVATSRRLMGVVLGGRDTAPSPEPVAGPCRVLGVEPRVKPGATDVAFKSCSWRVDGRQIEVAVARGRGPVGEFWDENLFVGGDPEDAPAGVRVPGADAALLASGPGKQGVGVALARGSLSWVVTVTGRARDVRPMALELAAALARADW